MQCNLIQGPWQHLDAGREAAFDLPFGRQATGFARSFADFLAHWRGIRGRARLGGTRQEMPGDLSPGCLLRLVSGLGRALCLKYQEGEASVAAGRPMELQPQGQEGGARCATLQLRWLHLDLVYIVFLSLCVLFKYATFFPPAHRPSN